MAADPRTLARVLNAKQKPHHFAHAVRNAAEIIKKRQGGIGTVYVGDIKALLSQSGLHHEHIDEAIRSEARAGRATLARSSTVHMAHQQQSGGVTVEGETEPYHTVTFK